ncbi:MAG: zf-HC2 domain-containing protein [Myxococcales bacterium]|nr:zf-HC2 domain-containing protein [Myxococcales bacterium]
MHCEDCQNLLLDLAYGELDEARAVEVRAHADGCAECGASWAKLSRGRTAAAMLPVALAPAPSAALLAAIDSAMGGAAVATEKPQDKSPDRSGARSATTSAKPAAAKTRDSKPSMAAVKPLAANNTDAAQQSAESQAGGAVVPLRPARWLERIAALAMRREVAMAAVFLMAVGVGVTTLYNPSRNPAVTEEDRATEVIPAVEVSQDPASASARSAVRRAASAAEPDLRGRSAERVEAQRAARSNAAPIAAPSAPTRQDPRSESADDNAMPAANNLRQAQAGPVQQPAQSNVLPQFAMRNAGAPTAGVQQQALSPSEIAARTALESGDSTAALAHFRSALAAASDDVTRARLQREISTIEATQAMQAAASAQAANNASNTAAVQAAQPTVSTQQANSSESSYRRPTRSRAVQRPMPAGNRTSGSHDSMNSLGFKRHAAE